MQQISDFIKLPPYPDIHRTVSIFVRYAGALTANRGSCQPSSLRVDRAHASATARTHEQYESTVLEAPASQTIGHGSSSENLSAPSDAALHAGAAGAGSAASANGNPTVNPAGPGAGVGPGGPVMGMEVPNWTLSTPIADSFGLFEEGQTDVFDFLPTMAGM